MLNFDVSSFEGRAKIHHVLIMVHGIRDFGGWQEELDRALPTHGIATVGIKYGYFDVFRFLFPLQWFRVGVVSKVAQRVREAQTLYPNAKFSYLAHSFGTYVVAKMLIDDPNFIANRIVFCGSVLKSDFPFSKLRGFSAPLLNEVGTRDIWPFLAASLTWGYGSAGSVGFGQPYVKDRFHHHGHSQFLSAKFAQDYWVPFLQNGQLIEGVVPPPPNFTRRLLSTFSIKYFLVALLSFVAVWWKIYRPDLNCTERWLNQKEYNSCFQESKDESVPIIVEGRRSWFGYGNDEFNAKWVFRSTNICYDSRSLLDRDNFAELNARLTNLGYIPISVKSFLSSDNTERFQSTWLYEKESAANCPQY